MKKFFGIIVSCFPLLVMGQGMSFDEFKKKQQAEFNQFKEKTQAEYDAFRKKANEDYAKFMESAWENKGIQKAVEPAPVKTLPPVVVKEEPVKPEQPKEEPIKHETVEPIQSKPAEPIAVAPKPIPVLPDVVIVPKPTPAPEPIAPVEVKPEVTTKPVNVKFYGTDITINFPKDDGFKLPSLKQGALANAWKQLSEEKYDVVVNNVLKRREALKLCDWAYLQMVKAVCEKQYGKTNEATFMLTYLMTQSGYRVRMASSAAQNKLYLLFATQYYLYSLSYITIDNERFYILDGKQIGDLALGKELCTCLAKFNQECSFSMQIAADQCLTYSPTENRKLTSKRGLSATLNVNKNGIDFYNNYPRAYFNNDATTTWVAYANTPLDKTTRNALYPLLKKNIQGLSERDAVDMILNWVQTAFEYGYDDQIWGGDRPFFPAETLYYPYCDCEDRSILFSRIIRDIMGLDVVLLYYPGHLASAVKFRDDTKGDYVTYRGQRYIVCDPTYIGSHVGMTMPSMNNASAKIVVLK